MGHTPLPSKMNISISITDRGNQYNLNIPPKANNIAALRRCLTELCDIVRSLGVTIPGSNGGCGSGCRVGSGGGVHGSSSQSKKRRKLLDFPSNPASKLPAGWTMRIVPRMKAGKGPKSDKYYFSPKQQIMFRSISEVNRFLEQMKEVGDDETKAQELLKKLSSGRTKRMTGKTINNNTDDDNDDDDDNHDDNGYVDFGDGITGENDNDEEQSSLVNDDSIPSDKYNDLNASDDDDDDDNGDNDNDDNDDKDDVNGIISENDDEQKNNYFNVSEAEQSLPSWLGDEGDEATDYGCIPGSDESCDMVRFDS
jgi:hypothetical protein